MNHPKAHLYTIGLKLRSKSMVPIANNSVPVVADWSNRKCAAMAIAYINVSMISRGKGRSAVAAAAYRSGEKLENEREGTTYDYSRKRGIVYSGILAPANAPEWATNRGKIWNEVEKVEKQKNAQVAREVTIALPHELTKEQHIVLAQAYAQTFVNEGMVADLSIHDTGDGNPHAHIMLTTRPFNEDGTWGAKSRKEYMLDEQGGKIKLASGEYKSRKIDTTDWNTIEKLLEWRQRYEHITNDHLAKHGYKERISVDTLEAQGIDKKPTVHLGHYAHQLEQQGIPSARGNINRAIQAENHQHEELKHQLDATFAAIQEEQNRQEILKREEARRQEVIRQKTITEEALQRKTAEWERLAREAMKQQPPQPEPSAWEALKQEAAKREDARKKAEQEVVARREMERKFVRPHQLQQPARIIRPKRRVRHVDWSTFAEGVKQARMQSGQLDWAKLAEQAQARRVDWSKLAQQQRVDWKQLAEQAEARRTDWQKLAEQQESQKTDWQQLVEEARKRREQPPQRDERDRDQDRSR